MIIKLLVEGGDMKPGPAIGQKLGPLGINLGKVIQEVNASTKSFKGVKVPVELNINKDKSFTVKVLSPPTTELLKKELGIEKASGDHKKVKSANASIEQIISIAKTKFPNMLSKDFKSTVKTVVGSCVSAEILIECKEPKEIIADIDSGKYDKEINSMKTDTSPERKKELLSYFNQVKEKQEAQAKKEEAEKEEKEKQAEAEKAAAPAAGAKKEEAAPAKGAAGKKEAAPAAAGAKGAAAGGAKKEAPKKK